MENKEPEKDQEKRTLQKEFRRNQEETIQTTRETTNFSMLSAVVKCIVSLFNF